MDIHRFIKQHKKKSLIISISLIFLLLSHPFFLRLMGNYLVYETENLTPTQVAIVLGGGSNDRIKKGVELYHKHLVEKLIITGNKERYRYSGNITTEYAKYIDIDPSDLILIPSSTSTLSDATLTLPIISPQKPRSITIITSRFHTKRAYKVFNAQYKKYNISVQMIATDDGIIYGSWWTDYEMSERILIEWAKTIIYWFK